MPQLGQGHEWLRSLRNTSADQALVVTSVAYFEGSRFAGYSFFVKDNRLHYVHNYLGLEGCCRLGGRLRSTNAAASGHKRS